MSNGESVPIVFGAWATDELFFFAPIDLDGDGKTDIAARPSERGQFVRRILRSSTGYNETQPAFVYRGINGVQ